MHKIRLLTLKNVHVAADVTTDDVRLTTFELGYNVMKWNEYFVSLQTSVVLTEWYHFMVNSKELLTGSTEYLTPQTRCRINWCCHSWVPL
jgi:hypothetical protein